MLVNKVLGGRVCINANPPSATSFANFSIANAESLIYNYRSRFSEVRVMAVGYKKLWKLLIDRDIKKKIYVRQLA
jgi:hypothetical protein